MPLVLSTDSVPSSTKVSSPVTMTPPCPAPSGSAFSPPS